MSQSYFDKTLPPGVSNATVSIVDNEGQAFLFSEDPKVKGDYRWIPAGKVFGKTGNTYTLNIIVNGEYLTSKTTMGRVPVIDSVTFKRSDNKTDGQYFYRAQFWARDVAGSGDTYWIRAYKNSILLNKPSEINLAYDAPFSKGSDMDGVTFIQPIRDGINPNDTENDKPVSPYVTGDSVYVEIYSLTEASFDYLTQVQTETDRPGGFAELFSRPLANVSTNLQNLNTGGVAVVGFFNVSAVSGKGRKF
jgi:Domain of unknown function (DUF4249)